MAGQILWNVGPEGYRLFSFLSFLRGKQFFKLFFQRFTIEDNCSDTLNFTFHSFSSHKWQKGEIKHRNQVSWKPWVKHLLFYFRISSIASLYMTRIWVSMFPMFSWGILCSVRSCVFWWIFHYNLWSCPITDTFLWTIVSHFPSTQFCHWAKSLQILRVHKKQTNIHSRVKQSKRQTRWVIVTTVFSLNISRTKTQEKKKILLKLICMM